MQNKEVKILSRYDLNRIVDRSKAEFGEIKRGTEDDYYPQLGYIEHEIYSVWLENPISDYELKEAIEIIIYDLKSYIDNKEYNYIDVVDKKVIDYAKELEKLFNPFINKEIKINDDAKNNLKELFKLPIICLSRIYISIDFWNKRYGKNGYFKMLEEMVISILEIGNFPYALDEKYLV